MTSKGFVITNGEISRNITQQHALQPKHTQANCFSLRLLFASFSSARNRLLLVRISPITLITIYVFRLNARILGAPEDPMSGPKTLSHPVLVIALESCGIRYQKRGSRRPEYNWAWSKEKLEGREGVYIYTDAVRAIPTVTLPSKPQLLLAPKKNQHPPHLQLTNQASDQPTNQQC